MRTRLMTTALAALAVGAAACGVSTNEEPQPIPRENVPGDLLEVEEGPIDDVELDEDNSQLIQVWFLIEDDEGAVQLHALDRRVLYPARAAVRIDELFATGRNPSEEEREQGISSAIPPNSRLTALPTQDGTVLEVNLTNDFYGRGGNNFMRAVAQLVFTVTEIPNVEAVRFVNEEGERIAVPDDGGESHEDPVGRDDYATLDPSRD
jgi:spore germination protein GerM